jgi:small subunit ribosomal protein S6
MKQQKHNLYEGMYVIKATLSDEARHKALDRIQKGITQRGGEVLKIHDQGRRRLAYQVNGHKEGYYFILYFSLTPEVISELWQEYHLNEDLIRFVTLRTEKVMEKIEFKSLEEPQ